MPDKDGRPYLRETRKKALELIKKEPPEVQESLRRLERKTYPVTARVLAEWEGEQEQ